MTFRFAPKWQALCVLVLSALSLSPRGWPGPTSALLQLAMLAWTGSLMLQFSGLTLGGSSDPAVGMSAWPTVANLLVGLPLCYAGTLVLMLVFGGGVIVTSEVASGATSFGLHSDPSKLLLAFAAWNFAIMGVGVFVALLPIAAVMAIVGKLFGRKPALAVAADGA